MTVKSKTKTDPTPAAVVVPEPHELWELPLSELTAMLPEGLRPLVAQARPDGLPDEWFGSRVVAPIVRLCCEVNALRARAVELPELVESARARARAARAADDEAQHRYDEMREDAPSAAELVVSKGRAERAEREARQLAAELSGDALGRAGGHSIAGKIERKREAVADKLGRDYGDVVREYRATAAHQRRQAEARAELAAIEAVEAAREAEERRNVQARRARAAAFDAALGYI